MLLFRGTDWTRGLSPEQAQKVMGEWMAWFDRLTAAGKVKAGHPLEAEGKIVSGRNGRIVADGPFAESKELVGGFAVMELSGMDEAVEMCRRYADILGGTLEIDIRPLDVIS